MDLLTAVRRLLPVCCLPEVTPAAHVTRGSARACSLPGTGPRPRPRHAPSLCPERPCRACAPCPRPLEHELLCGPCLASDPAAGPVSSPLCPPGLSSPRTPDSTRPAGAAPSAGLLHAWHWAPAGRPGHPSKQQVTSGRVRAMPLPATRPRGHVSFVNRLFLGYFPLSENLILKTDGNEMRLNPFPRGEAEA